MPDDLSSLIRRRIRFLAWLAIGLGSMLFAGPGMNSDGGEATRVWATVGMSTLALGSLVLWAAR